MPVKLGDIKPKIIIIPCIVVKELKKSDWKKLKNVLNNSILTPKIIIPENINMKNDKNM